MLMANSNALTVPDHDLYVSIATENDDIRFGFGVTAAEAKSNLPSSLAKKRKQKTSATPAANQLDQRPEQKFKKLLSNINKSMAGYGELISLSGALAKTVTGPLTSHKVTKFARNNLDLVDESGTTKTYGMRDEKTLDFMALMETNNTLLSGFLFLPPAILMGCVSFYDSAISDIMKAFLSLNPARFRNSDRTFTAAQLFDMKDMSNVIDVIIDSEVDNVMRGSHTNQIDYLEKIGKIDFKDKYGNWSSFVEIFERRNIVSHNNGIVNDIYVNNCKAAGISKLPPFGTKLKLTRGYMRKSANILHEVLLLILFELWNKIEKNQKKELYYGINETGFDLIRAKNYGLASRILEFALNKKDQNASEEARRMIAVNLAISTKFSSEASSFEEALNHFQWDACSDKFQICIAAIREDIDTVQRLMPRVRMSEDIVARDFQTWPAFHWVRTNPAFLDSVRETYGIQI